MPIHKVLLFALLGWVLTAAGLAAEPAAAAEQAAAAEPVAEAEQAAQAEGESQAEELPVLEDIETILTQPLDQAEYVESQRCLSRYKFDRVEFLDNEHVLFIGRGGKAWLNTLRAPCVGLRRRDIPSFEYRGAKFAKMTMYNDGMPNPMMPDDEMHSFFAGLGTYMVLGGRIERAEGGRVGA